jgi:hypothetical protein
MKKFYVVAIAIIGSSGGRVFMTMPVSERVNPI